MEAIGTIFGAILATIYLIRIFTNKNIKTSKFCQSKVYMAVAIGLLEGLAGNFILAILWAVISILNALECESYRKIENSERD